MSLRAKLQLFIITLLISSNALIAFILIEKQKALIQKGFEQQTQSIVSLITQDAVKLILLDTPDAATEIAEKFESLDNLRQVIFYDNQLSPILKIDTELAKGSSMTIRSELVFKGTRLGEIKLIFSGEQADSLLNELYHHLIRIVVFSLFFATVLAYFIDRFFSQRISQLNRALSETAKTQDYTQRLPSDYRDEIGDAFRNFNDLVTQTDKLTTTLTNQVNHDYLTGLYNRFYINKKINQLVSQTDRSSTKALCYLDLDRFKLINDTFGHIAGDKFLVSLSRELKKSLEQEPDLSVARMGGDEFVLLFEDTSEAHTKTLLDLCLKTISGFKLIFREQQLSVGVSIGAVLFNDDSESKHALMTLADTACYHSKQEGGNTASIYWSHSEELKTERESIYWVQKIKNSIKEKKLIVYLQPIVASDQFIDNKNSYEVLVRLEQDGQIISPFSYIPTLERYGMMYEFDIYMLTATLSLAKKNLSWLDQVDHIAINLSALTVSMPKASVLIYEKIKQSGVPFHKICFEITETTALSNIEQAKAFVSLLKQQGCKFALDDFGTGMASFDYLYKLPLDYLKIDGSFIKDITKDPVKAEMVKAMQNIAQLMGLKTIAEYVENQQIENQLQTIGIHYYQGYFYSAPKPFEEILATYIQKQA